MASYGVCIDHLLVLDYLLVLSGTSTLLGLREHVDLVTEVGHNDGVYELDVSVAFELDKRLLPRRRVGRAIVRVGHGCFPYYYELWFCDIGTKDVGELVMTL